MRCPHVRGAVGGHARAAAEASLAAIPPLPSAAFVTAGAVLLLRFGASPGRPALLGPGTVGFGLAIIAVTSFWAANSYAQSIGVAAAKTIDADPTRLSVVTILSREPLDVPGSLVVATRVPDAEGSGSTATSARGC